MTNLIINTTNFEMGGGVEMYKRGLYYKLSTYSNRQGELMHTCYSIPVAKYTIEEISSIVERNNIGDLFRPFMTKKGYRVE
ncbi:MAG: hypothetical protein ABII90_06655 [Bacteroidota bacterium]